MRRIFFCIFIAVVLNVDGQYVPSSPCPSVFAYQSDGGGGMYGLIHLVHTGDPVSNLHIRANFTLAARLPSTYAGQIETIGKEGLLQNFNRGAPLKYRVNFPLISPIPRLTAIVVNGDTLCYGPGDLPAPNQYITTISLDHMLYLKPGAHPGSIHNYYEPGLSPSLSVMDDILGPFGDMPSDNQGFTINSIDNKGTWTGTSQGGSQSNNQPAEPVYKPPVVRPVRPVTRPKPSMPEYYPIQTTEAPRPLPQPPPRPPPRPPVQTAPQTPPRMPDVSTQVECGVIAGGNERIPLIYQGASFPRGDLPWLVAVYKRQEGSLTFICAGSLVSDRHVVTAAHCMHQKSKISTIKDIVVKIGVYNLEDWGDDISVTRTLQAAAIHENYNATTLENDILVFTLERTVEFNTYIRPACLWNGNTDLSRIVGASGVVAGWGASEVGPVGQGEPRMVRIPVVSTAQCRASRPEFHKLTSARTLCAGDRNGSGPCLGDSGGGLFILDNGRWRLRGVVSLSLRPQSGDNTCNLNEYIVFTDTAQYLDWIRKILSQNYFDT